MNLNRYIRETDLALVQTFFSINTLHLSTQAPHSQGLPLPYHLNYSLHYFLYQDGQGNCFLRRPSCRLCRIPCSGSSTQAGPPLWLCLLPGRSPWPRSSRRRHRACQLRCWSHSEVSDHWQEGSVGSRHHSPQVSRSFKLGSSGSTISTSQLTSCTSPPPFSHSGQPVTAGNFEFLNCTRSLIDRGYKLNVPKNFQNLDGDYTYTWGMLRNAKSKLHVLSTREAPNSKGQVDAQRLIDARYAELPVEARTFILATADNGATSYLEFYPFAGSKAAPKSGVVYTADNKYGSVAVSTNHSKHRGSTFLHLQGNGAANPGTGSGSGSGSSSTRTSSTGTGAGPTGATRTRTTGTATGTSTGTSSTTTGTRTSSSTSSATSTGGAGSGTGGVTGTVVQCPNGDDGTLICAGVTVEVGSGTAAQCPNGDDGTLLCHGVTVTAGSGTADQCPNGDNGTILCAGVEVGTGGGNTDPVDPNTGMGTPVQCPNGDDGTALCLGVSVDTGSGTATQCPNGDDGTLLCAGVSITTGSGTDAQCPNGDNGTLLCLGVDVTAGSGDEDECPYGDNGTILCAGVTLCPLGVCIGVGAAV